MQKTLKEKDDDDDYKQETDPAGFFLYQKLLEDPFKQHMKFITKVSQDNTESALFHQKAILFFLKAGNILQAIASLEKLHEHHAGTGEACLATI